MAYGSLLIIEVDIFFIIVSGYHGTYPWREMRASSRSTRRATERMLTLKMPGSSILITLGIGGYMLGIRYKSPYLPDPDDAE